MKTWRRALQRTFLLKIQDQIVYLRSQYYFLYRLHYIDEKIKAYKIKMVNPKILLITHLISLLGNCTFVTKLSVNVGVYIVRLLPIIKKIKLTSIVWGRRWRIHSTKGKSKCKAAIYRVSQRPLLSNVLQTSRIKCMLNKRVKLDTSLQEQQAIADPKEFKKIIFHCVKKNFYVNSFAKGVPKR